MKVELCGFHPVVYTYQIYYLSRLYTTYSNSCKLVQPVNYVTCFGLSAIIRLAHKCGLIKVYLVVLPMGSQGSHKSCIKRDCNQHPLKLIH